MASSETSASIATSTDGLPKGRPTVRIEERRDKACRPLAAKTFADAFNDDPTLRWVLHDPSKPTNLIEDASYMDLFFTNAICSMALAGGGTIINSGGDWGCAGVLVPPGKNTESLGVYVKTAHRLLPVAWRGRWAPMKKALLTYPKYLHHLRHRTFPPSRSIHLRKLNFYYVFFLGTLHSARGRGLGGAFISHAQSLASAKGVPIYFECSKDSSRLFYEHLGFRTVCMVRTGKGEVDQEGFAKGDREGVRLWAMVWWPEGCWPEGVEYWDGVTEDLVK